MNSLSKSELEIMKCIWDFGRPVCNKDVLIQMNKKYNKEWKIQTVSTYLQRLALKNYLEIIKDKKIGAIGKKYFYTPKITVQEFRKIQVEEFIEFWDDEEIEYDLLVTFLKIGRIWL